MANVPLPDRKRRHQTSACDHCRRCKTRCTGYMKGLLKCGQCQKKGLVCTFTPQRRRGPPAKKHRTQGKGKGSGEGLGLPDLDFKKFVSPQSSPFGTHLTREFYLDRFFQTTNHLFEIISDRTLLEVPETNESNMSDRSLFLISCALASAIADANTPEASQQVVLKARGLADKLKDDASLETVSGFAILAVHHYGIDLKSCHQYADTANALVSRLPTSAARDRLHSVVRTLCANFKSDPVLAAGVCEDSVQLLAPNQTKPPSFTPTAALVRSVIWTKHGIAVFPLLCIVMKLVTRPDPSASDFDLSCLRIRPEVARAMLEETRFGSELAAYTYERSTPGLTMLRAFIYFFIGDMKEACNFADAALQMLEEKLKALLYCPASGVPWYCFLAYLAYVRKRVDIIMRLQRVLSMHIKPLSTFGQRMTSSLMALHSLNAGGGAQPPPENKQPHETFDVSQYFPDNVLDHLPAIVDVEGIKDISQSNPWLSKTIEPARKPPVAPAALPIPQQLLRMMSIHLSSGAISGMNPQARGPPIHGHPAALGPANFQSPANPGQSALMHFAPRTPRAGNHNLAGLTEIDPTDSVYAQVQPYPAQQKYEAGAYPWKQPSGGKGPAQAAAAAAAAGNAVFNAPIGPVGLAHMPRMTKDGTKPDPTGNMASLYAAAGERQLQLNPSPAGTSPAAYAPGGYQFANPAAAQQQYRHIPGLPLQPSAGAGGQAGPNASFPVTAQWPMMYPGAQAAGGAYNQPNGVVGIPGATGQFSLPPAMFVDAAAYAGLQNANQKATLSAAQGGAGQQAGVANQAGLQHAQLAQISPAVAQGAGSGTPSAVSAAAAAAAAAASPVMYATLGARGPHGALGPQVGATPDMLSTLVYDPSGNYNGTSAAAAASTTAALAGMNPGQQPHPLHPQANDQSFVQAAAAAAVAAAAAAAAAGTAQNPVQGGAGVGGQGAPVPGMPRGLPSASPQSTALFSRRASEEV